MTANRYFLRLLLLLAAVLSLGERLTAQNNPYKIDDQLYGIYTRALKARQQPQGLLVADTMRQEAVRTGDLKAECIALTIPVYYHFVRTDYDALAAAVDTLKAVSRRNNYLQYYYYGFGEQINWLLNKGRSLLALQLSEEMAEQAKTDQNHYGIYKSLSTQGNIYYIRGDVKRSIQCQQAALDYMLNYLPNQDPADIYIFLARAYRIMGGDKNNQLALTYTDKAIESAKTYTAQMGGKLEKCACLYALKRYEEFARLYDECMEEMQQKGNIQSGTQFALRIYRLTLDKQYDAAHKLADTSSSKATALTLHTLIAAAAHDYEAAFRYQQQYMQHKDTLVQQIQSSDLAEMSIQLDNERIKQEAQNLLLQNTELNLNLTRLNLQNTELNLNLTRLNLQNTELELERISSQADLHRMHAENDSLQLQNKELELKRVQAEAEHQRILLQEERTASQHRIILFSLLLGFAAIIIILLAVNQYRRHKLLLVLRRRNKELVIARDHAEESDRMKMNFIQNMSHEIRTPLNAIVGFSQVLTTPGMQLGDEEKLEFANLIQHNSDLLTKLVNDVLDLALLESGQSDMNMKPHAVNEMALLALSSMKHHQPDKVRLYYTSEVSDEYTFVTDDRRVIQVLTNFLTNAEKYTEQGEIHLHCSLSEHPGNLTFSVTDTGPGIPPEQAEEVFQRFKKLDDFKQGTGLGLNICRIIAQRLHGEVKVDTSYTDGARFLFILPLAEE